MQKLINDYTIGRIQKGDCWIEKTPCSYLRGGGMKADSVVESGGMVKDSKVTIDIEENTSTIKMHQNI